MTTTEARYRPSSTGYLLASCLALAGLVSVGAGFLFAPERTWIDLFVAFQYLAGIGLGGLLIVALHHVTGAHWSIPFRRVPETMSAVLPVAAVGLVCVFLFRSSIFPWTAAAYPHAADSPLKQLWLNYSFFAVRSVCYLGLWLAFAWLMVRFSAGQNLEWKPLQRERVVRLSAGFLVVFGITCWLSSYDWIMSLEPDWASTIFGVYNFAGIFLSGLAAAILLILWLGQTAPLRNFVTRDRLHDLGVLLFAFSSFWMYTWFCQYMLIWYVNGPEETSYLRRRWEGNWATLLWVDLAYNWGLPFAVLLFRSAKRSPLVLGTVAVFILAGRWIDLTMMIGPSQSHASPIPGFLEAGILAGAAGLFLLVFLRGLRRAPLVPCQTEVQPTTDPAPHAGTIPAHVS
jgi:hypothetical protein